MRRKNLDLIKSQFLIIAIAIVILGLGGDAFCQTNYIDIGQTAGSFSVGRVYEANRDRIDFSTSLAPLGYFDIGLSLTFDEENFGDMQFTRFSLAYRLRNPIDNFNKFSFLSSLHIKKGNDYISGYDYSIILGGQFDLVRKNWVMINTSLGVSTTNLLRSKRETYPGINSSFTTAIRTGVTSFLAFNLDGQTVKGQSPTYTIEISLIFHNLGKNWRRTQRALRKSK